MASTSVWRQVEVILLSEGQLRREPPGYHELLEALEQEGCPLCRLSLKAAAAYVDTLLYEMVNDSQLRQRLRRSRGLCHTHAWQMVQPGELVRTLAERGDAGRGEDLAQALGPLGECPACQHQEEMEELYLAAFLKSVDDSTFWEAYQASAGPCLPHVQALLRLCRNANVQRRLVAAQRAFWERLQGELAEFIRKNDHRFRHEGFGPEGDSWQRAVAQVVGHRAL